MIMIALIAGLVGCAYDAVDGSLKAANTELHQVQTAIIAAMADAKAATLAFPAEGATVFWAGGDTDCPYAQAGTMLYYAKDYIYGPFRAAYEISNNGTITQGVLVHANLGDHTPWSGIEWDTTNNNWMADDGLP